MSERLSFFFSVSRLVELIARRDHGVKQRPFKSPPTYEEMRQWLQSCGFHIPAGLGVEDDITYTVESSYGHCKMIPPDAIVWWGFIPQDIDWYHGGHGAPFMD